jgi:hypothetical protein
VTPKQAERAVALAAAVLTVAFGIAAAEQRAAKAIDGGGHSRGNVVTRLATTGTATTVVYEIDVTKSVTTAFVRDAKDAFAAGVPRLVHDGQGPIRIYLRVISHQSGSDSAAIATYTVPAIPTCVSNPFDLRCRQEHEAALVAARERAQAIADDIRNLHLTRTSTGTALRGAFASAAQLLNGARGARWLVAATDLRPANVPAMPVTINLRGVHVVILLACDQSFSKCLSRKTSWGDEFRRDGAVTVTFLSTQQSDLLFPIVNSP